MSERSLNDRIYDAIRKSGLMNKTSLDAVEKYSQKKGEKSLIRFLEHNDIIPDAALLNVLSEELEIPPLSLARFNPQPDIISLIPKKLILHHLVIPISRIGDILTLAVSDPTDIFLLDDIKTVTGCEIGLILASSKDIENAIRRIFKSEEEDIASIIEKEEEKQRAGDIEVVSRHGDLDVVEITKESKAAPIVKMVEVIIGEAIKKRASDIHLEPQEKALKIRYRIDGELHEAFDLPKRNMNAIIARIKIMSKLDITETRVPQDGRFRIKMGKKEIDFRVSVLPAIFGNKIVLRALDKSNLSVGLESLGFLPESMSDFKTALARPFGIILVTGPTGSGKSTTLYSVLNEMNSPDRNIVTVEDPVEYQVAGITQIAIQSEIGLDFPNGLRAILRQSPDVIMVGEIRDFDTADIAIKASLTGQMVLSTLHTNDAVGAITRLINMGIEPFLVASSLVLTSAQRLLRTICPLCKEETEIPKKLIEEIGQTLPEIYKVEKFFKGRGCDKCNKTGYKGRTATLETVLIDDKIRDMVNRKVSEAEIKEYLRQRGVRTLRENSLIKFIKGETTLEEVYRVT
ncbi:MAG: GspE/PulE family protein [Candidatus Omnitrophica bacterium]|nr:GspE/PulE family protein [Candidatus Omnitrophota bacterium]